MLTAYAVGIFALHSLNIVVYIIGYDISMAVRSCCFFADISEGPWYCEGQPWSFFANMKGEWGYGKHDYQNN